MHFKVQKQISSEYTGQLKQLITEPTLFDIYEHRLTNLLSFLHFFKIFIESA